MAAGINRADHERAQMYAPAGRVGVQTRTLAPKGDGRGLLVAELRVERGQKTREMVHLLRAVHHQVAGIVRVCAEDP